MITDEMMQRAKSDFEIFPKIETVILMSPDDGKVVGITRQQVNEHFAGKEEREQVEPTFTKEDMDGFGEFCHESNWTFIDGDWYHETDTEGRAPMTMKKAFELYLTSKQGK